MSSSVKTTVHIAYTDTPDIIHTKVESAMDELRMQIIKSEISQRQYEKGKVQNRINYIVCRLRR